MNKKTTPPRLYLDITEAMMPAMEQMAEARGETVSSLVRDLIREELQRNGVAISITTKIV